jgi:16S rRNA (guanine527-N7)-methyltransferase
LDVLDCEAILPHINPQQKILDIGSGAGLPGLIIAIKKPSALVTMSEKNNKKAYFIRKMINTLKLTNALGLRQSNKPTHHNSRQI